MKVNLINSFLPKLFLTITCLLIVHSVMAQDSVVLRGTASYYHLKFEGRRTANGETFYNDSLTAAHKTLPFGTIVQVTHLKNKKMVTVRINDRLPSNSTREIDLSQEAAKRLMMIKSGLAKVRIEVIEDY